VIYAAFILLILAVITCHTRDWNENRKTGRVNHSKALKVKILLSIPAGVFFTINLSGWPVMWNWFIILASAKSAIFAGAWFMFLFNGLWGVRADKDWFYRSTAVGSNISKFDRFVLHWPKWLYILFIVALVTGATLFYFL
jgi:hypothetical protein